MGDNFNKEPSFEIQFESEYEKAKSSLKMFADIYLSNLEKCQPLPPKSWLATPVLDKDNFYGPYDKNPILSVNWEDFQISLMNLLNRFSHLVKDKEVFSYYLSKIIAFENTGLLRENLNGLFSSMEGDIAYHQDQGAVLSIRHTYLGKLENWLSMLDEMDTSSKKEQYLRLRLEVLKERDEDSLRIWIERLSQHCDSKKDDELEFALFDSCE